MLNSDTLELTSKERLSSYIDGRYSLMLHSSKNDEFDFVSKDRTWALEQTSCISESSIEVEKYDTARSKGKSVDSSRIDGVVIDASGDVLAYYGGGMDETRKHILKAIIDKDRKCKARLIKEPTFRRVDLVVTIPENPLFSDENSIKPLNTEISKLNTVFTKIYILFYNSIYDIDPITGKYRYISYNYK